jgi:hypothetical protein
VSIAARAALCKALFFQADSQRSDLMDPTVTKTELVALLLGLTDLGWHIEITSVKTDHSDDSNLGLYCHANGYAADLWPLLTAQAGDYLDAGSSAFTKFLADLRASPWLYQIGLGGSAWSPGNAYTAGPSAFRDDGEDHVHVGASG